MFLASAAPSRYRPLGLKRVPHGARPGLRSLNGRLTGWTLAGARSVDVEELLGSAAGHVERLEARVLELQVELDDAAEVAA